MFTFDVGKHGKVSAAIHRAPEPLHATLILAHGAGAPRTHPFMTSMAARLAKRGVDVVTFNFLYSEAGRKMPDRVELLEDCWRAAIAAVRARGFGEGKSPLRRLSRAHEGVGTPGGLHTEKLFIGGKSMGGRIATHIAGDFDVAGIVLLGYPMHPPGKPHLVRDEILRVRVPMIVVQGSRDTFGNSVEMKKFLAPLARARLFIVDDGDHSLTLPKSCGKEMQDRVLDEAAAAVATFIGGRRGRPPIPPPNIGGRSLRPSIGGARSKKRGR